MAKKRRSKTHTEALIGVYFTPEEKERIAMAAKSQGKTLSEYCRDAVLPQLYNDELEPEPVAAD